MRTISIILNFGTQVEIMGFEPTAFRMRTERSPTELYPRIICGFHAQAYCITFLFAVTYSMSKYSIRANAKIFNSGRSIFQHNAAYNILAKMRNIVLKPEKWYILLCIRKNLKFRSKIGSNPDVYWARAFMSVWLIGRFFWV